jgi:hypothetical protein
MSSERQSGSAGGQPNDVTARPLDGPGRQADEAAGDAISWHDQGMAGDPPATARTSPTNPRSNSRPALASWSSAAAAEPAESLDDTAASYILKWADRFVDDGVLPAMERLQIATNPEPVAFAFLDTSDYKIKVLHSVCRINLEEDSHEGHDDIVGFIGDRRQSRRGTWRDPPTVTVPPDTFKQVSTKATTATKCNAAKQDEWTTFLEASRNAPRITVPLLLPLPHLWLKFFVLQSRHPLEAWSFLKQETENWEGPATSELKKAKKIVRDWSRATATGQPVPQEDASEDEPTPLRSEMELEFESVTYENEAEDWLEEHLAKLFPTSAPTSATTNSAATGDIHQYIRTSARAIERLSHITTSQEERQTEIVAGQRARAEQSTTSKQISDIRLAQLLGQAGLSWSEHQKLPTWFSRIHEQPDKQSKKLVVKEMFSVLAMRDRYFRNFENVKLFSDIIEHNFTPGLTANDAHHGMSILAFTTKSANTVKAERDEEEYYGAANTLTPDHVRKHRKGKMVPLATTLDELLRQMTRYEKTLRELWGPYCDLYVQIRDLRTDLESNEDTLMNDPAAVKRLIPTIYWAVQIAASRFFRATTTVADLQLDDPHVVSCDLKSHAQQLAYGTELRLMGMPREWEAQALDERKRPAERSPHEPPAYRPRPPNPSPGRERQEQRQSGRPDRRDPNHPFRTSQEVQELMRRTNGRVRLNSLMRRVGINTIADLARKCGVPENTCFRDACFGMCPGEQCRLSHSGLAAAKIQILYRELLPGIRQELAELRQSE